MKTLTVTLSAMVLMLGLAGTSSAALVISDLNDGSIDQGFSNAWGNGSNNVFVIAAPDLTYANYGITQTGTTQRIYSANASPDRQDVRTLSAPLSGETWFSVLVNVPTGSEYAGLTFNNSGNSYDPITTAARILLTPSELQVGLNGGGAATGTGTFAADTTHLLLGQMDIVGGIDTLNVWVDPDLTALTGLGDLGTANFTSTTVDFANSITDIGVAGRKGNSGSDVSIDAFRLSDNVGTAFFDVTGVEFVDAGGPEVPEPASIAIWSILGLCLAGYGYRRRRRNS